MALERRAILRGALAELPERRRELMTLLAADPSIDYCTVGETLAMPVGQHRTDPSARLPWSRARLSGRLDVPVVVSEGDYASAHPQPE